MLETSRKLGKGDQMYISGSGFVKIKTKDLLVIISDEEQDWNTMYTFRCEDPSDTIVVNNIIAHDY